jgi:hypothetical protein
VGSTVTSVFQRVNAGRVERFARDERLRQERMAAYSGFAGAITELRRGVISLWFVRQPRTTALSCRVAGVSAAVRVVNAGQKRRRVRHGRPCMRG